MPILPRVSIGCTEFDTALKNINDAVKEADDKMYTAKRYGYVCRGTVFSCTRQAVSHVVFD